MTELLVLLGGAVGAPTRYLLDGWISALAERRWARRLPVGTLTVNVLGCLILGGLAGVVQSHGVSSQVSVLIGTGFCGGLTTFSTFSVESIELLQRRNLRAAVIYLLASLIVGIIAAEFGYTLTSP